MKYLKLYEEELPSHFQIKDNVFLEFGEAGTLRNCRVAEVHFTESDVSYDIEVMVKGDGEDSVVTVLKGVDAEFVKAPEYALGAKKPKELEDDAS